ncbi:TrkH family potassium uptake protein [Haloarcula pellucida]|uniref:Potassium transporter TrkH n=1 Tax=Haloarcula pellucida TaxID=1427151 RepID=A0A830GR07_9EURY|nr:TrkH family potassium uptake protein [Halomicroarcula pellucida]MBX0348197.1 TrkH family potassium uptake protein [Halomicroarcula pellucida]GGN97421.1 potassium transporter TrkH [Halomicroarcula pellucida]
MNTVVDWRKSVALTGTVVKFLSVAMLVPLVVALVYGEDVGVFGVSIVGTVLLGLAVEQLDPGTELREREALLFVALTWFVVAVVGAVPYVLAGWGTASTLADPVNALFESMSGFSTTGATVMGEIGTDRHSHAIMMWRQVTQWLGGMGIIVLMVAILPELAVNGAQLISEEAPGPTLEKLTPRISETARILWQAYFAFTVLLAVLLYGLHLAGYAPNMDLYNSVAHAFSTLPTGGFSTKPASIAAFSAAVQWVIIPFMVVAGTNFALFWYLFDGEVRTVFEDTEFRAYAGATAVFTAVLFGLLFSGAAPALANGGTTEGAFANALRQAAFQVGSLMNSTGYATSDFAQWEAHSQLVLLLVMFVGGSAGSTGGGIKVVRWLIVLKTLRRELFHASHPDAVRPVRLGDVVVDEEAIRGVVGFTLLYLLVFGFAAVFIALDATRVGIPLTPMEAVGASLAAIGNIGPAFGRLGPFGSYLMLPDTTKVVMILLMWAGRLEIITVLVVFTRSFWQR